MPQAPLTHVATPPDGTGQMLHDGPHDIGPSATQAALHHSYPPAQLTPQTPPVQVAVPFDGTGQKTHAAPQALGSSAVQAPLHRSKPALHETPH